MISAQNHRQLLSGNRSFTWLFLALIMSWGCSSAKKGVHTDKQKTEIKPAPSSGAEKPIVKMDTISWKEIKPAETKSIEEPIKSESKVIPTENSDNVKETYTPLEPKGLKQYKMMLLAPFSTGSSDSSAIANESSIRFIQFYAGMQMAIQEYQSQKNGLSVQLDIVDEQSKSKVEDVLKACQSEKPNCIIGPYEIESLKYTAEWAKDKKVLAISPWISSSSITSENPYYLQIKAGLNTHFNTIGRHIKQHFKEEQVIIVSRVKDDSRTKHFIRESGLNCKEVVISEDELMSESAMVLEEYFLKDRPVVFVLPLTLAKDENYIYHFLRRVAAEKADRAVTIYGTYRWLDFKPEIVDYINTLNVRICLSNILDMEHPDLRNFKLRYYDKFKELPRNDVYEGYDLMKFILFMVNKSNPANGTSIDFLEPKYFQTRFILEAISKDQIQNKVDYHENRFAKIVEMHGYRFKIID